MTVSPNRPQDGNPQHKVGVTGVEPNDRTRVATLPPTLFKLPNLGAVSPPTNPVGATDLTDHESAPELPAQVESQWDATAIASRGTSLGDAVSQRGSAESTSSEWNWGARPDGRFTDPSQRASTQRGSIQGAPIQGAGANEPLDCQQVKVSSRSAPHSSSEVSPSEVSSAPTPPSPTTVTGGSPPRPSLADVPAGRSWMDSLGSHGVVIVLLLVVVAAALLTGQGDEDPTAKSLSTQSELLDFDELNVDLPLPTHAGGATLAESEPAVTDQSTLSPAGDPVAAATMATVVEKTEPVVQTPPPVAAEESAAPVATLEAPQSGVPGGLDHEFNQGFLSNGVKTNEFVTPNGGVEATTVGNRVDSPASDSGLPSLEELAGLQEQSNQADPSTSDAPTRRLTKTPAGIPDWSKYLPALDSAVEPDAGTSSFSNQVPQP